MRIVGYHRWLKSLPEGFSNAEGSWPLLFDKKEKEFYFFSDLVRIHDANSLHIMAPLIGLPGVEFQAVRYEDNQFRFWEPRRRNGDTEWAFDFTLKAISRFSLWVLDVPFHSCTPRRVWPSSSLEGDPEHELVCRFVKSNRAQRWK